MTFTMIMMTVEMKWFDVDEIKLDMGEEDLKNVATLDFSHFFLLVGLRSDSTMAATLGDSFTSEEKSSTSIEIS